MQCFIDLTRQITDYKRHLASNIEIRVGKTLREFGMQIDWLYPVLEKKGLAMEVIASYLRTDTSNLPAFLPIREYLDTLEWSANALNDAHLWLNIGLELNLGDLGLVGYLYQNSGTLGELLYSVERYQVIYMAGMHWKFSQHDSLCEGRYSIHHDYTEGVRHDIEFTISSAISLFSSVSDNPQYIEQINVPYPASHLTDVYSKLWGTNVHFGQACASIIFDSALLNAPIGNSDPRLRQLLQQQIEETLIEIEGRNEFIDQVRLLIKTTMGDELYDLSQLCRQLNISTRTLHRRLKKYDLNYLSLKEEIMVDLAKEALTKTDASITEIGLNLGFSEVSAFVRSFKRLCGVSPLQYRNKPISL